MKFATADFTLGAKQDDGYTLRQHLLSAWRQSGVKPTELAEAPPIPELAEYLWGYYLELHNRRQNYGWGHNPLTHLEIDAWKRNTKRRLDPWELSALLDIDDAYLASIPKKKAG